jgi:hypothetical protein
VREIEVPEWFQRTSSYSGPDEPQRNTSRGA